jgi:hypothetical protein
MQKQLPRTRSYYAFSDDYNFQPLVRALNLRLGTQDTKLQANHYHYVF